MKLVVVSKVSEYEEKMLPLNNCLNSEGEKDIIRHLLFLKNFKEHATYTNDSHKTKQQCAHFVEVSFLCLWNYLCDFS